MAIEKAILKLRRKDLTNKIVKEIKQFKEPEEKIRIMHVCGTHEYTISKSGIRSLLPEWIELIPGPGCPVCVCPAAYIDAAIQVGLENENTIIASFGDMLKVPGTKLSLMEARAKGLNLKLIYSPSEALQLAKENPCRNVMLLAVGFETTAPMVASQLLNNPPENFHILSAHRLIPPVMEYLLQREDVKIDAFIPPGHVSTIIGQKPFDKIARKYKVPMVIAGFEPVDVLLAILMLLKMLENGEHYCDNEYIRAVRYDGNLKAQKVIHEVFKEERAYWRGIGYVDASGLTLKNEFSENDAVKMYEIDIESLIKVEREHIVRGCRCSDIILGKAYPTDCPLFGKACTPQRPVGPCMVSSEGTCSIWFRYGGRSTRIT